MATRSGRQPWAGSTRSARLPADWESHRRPTVLARDGHTCQLCYADVCVTTATEVDHIKAGDDHSLSNLQATCAPCHRRKTAQEVPRPPTLRRTPEPHPGLLPPPAERGHRH
jgi:5-methylcytosine-specific restriction endonuclease McrA